MCGEDLKVIQQLDGHKTIQLQPAGVDLRKDQTILTAASLRTLYPLRIP